MEIQVTEEEEEQFIKIRVHCIGLFLPSKVIGPSLIMMAVNGLCGMYCLTLTQETAGLVSPLYEHVLILEKAERYSSLANFTGECLFTVSERCACYSRLDTQYTPKELTKKLEQLMTKTLFIPIEQCYSMKPLPDSLMKEFFNEGWKASPFTYAFLNCEHEEDRSVLEQYIEIYKDTRSKRYRNRKSFYENYWKEVVTALPAHTSSVERAIEHLLMYSKTDMVYKKEDILTLFKGWKQYKSIGSYFRYHCLGMEYRYGLYTLFKENHSLCNDISKMSYEHCLSLTNFCKCIKGLLDKGLNTPFNLVRKDIPLSLFDEIWQGQFYIISELIIKQYQPESDYTTFLERLLCFVLMFKLSKCLSMNATLEPIQVHNIYTVYHSLLTVGKPPKSDDLSLDLEADEPAEPFHRILCHFCQFIREENVKQWYPKETKSAIVKANTPLFFYSEDVANLDLEHYNADLCDAYILGQSLVSLYIHENKPIIEEKWQDDWAALKESTGKDMQQYNFVLFNASELKANKDLECIKTILFADLHNTVILRESNDVFFHKRISHFFAETQTDLAMPLFHRDHCLETRLFRVLPEKAIKETIIIPQCHTLSLTSMRNIIQMMIFYQTRIQRIVLIGSLSFIPFDSPGQGFLDLMRLLLAKEITPALYHKEERALEFATLLNDHWRLVECDSEKGLKKAQQEVFHFKEGNYSILYHLKKSDWLCQLLADTTSPQINCLYKSGKNLLFDSFNVKQKSLYQIQSMQMNELVNFDCINKLNAVFVMSKKTLLSLDKNQWLYLFTILTALYVIDEEEQDFKKCNLLDLLINTFKERKKPNLRYSYIVLNK